MLADSYLESERFVQLCRDLTDRANQVQQDGTTRDSLQLCAQAEVFRWFVPAAFGGWDWSEEEITRGYLELAKSCLTTTFVITQWASAVKRILGSDDQASKDRWLPELAAGKVMISVGISHLTTSRQHQHKPALSATPCNDGWRLDGYTPWVTGGPLCDLLVIGATAEDGTQILTLVETDSSGLVVQDSHQLMALTASQTGAIAFDCVVVPQHSVLAGPVENVLQAVAAGTTGGLQTSTLALGLSAAAIEFMEIEAAKRSILEVSVQNLARQQQNLVQQLLIGTRGEIDSTAESASLDRESLRTASNDLVLRATQAALIVAKGAGYVVGHPCERWCREAMFFLVWSCPQAVQMNQLCQLSFSAK